MSIEVGKRYYFVAHAYFHYVGTVTEVLGIRRVALADVVQVHSCGRSWTDFFKDGFKADTRYDVIGTVPDLTYLWAIAWAHKIPAEPAQRRAR